MGSLERRLKALEADLASDECPVCGVNPASLDPVTEYEVIWEDAEDAVPYDEEPDEEFCDGCGRQMGYVVVWDDLINHEQREPRESGD
jgi:hypothetical protein